MLILASTKSDLTVNKPRKRPPKQHNTIIVSPRAKKLCCNRQVLGNSAMRSLCGGHIEAGRSARVFFFVHPTLAFLRQSNVSLAGCVCIECHKTDEREALSIEASSFYSSKPTKSLFAAVGGELRVHIQDRPVAVVICSALAE